MQSSRPPKLTFRLDRKAFMTAVRYTNRYKQHPEAMESVIEEVQKRGAPEEDIAVIRMLLTAMRDASLDHEAAYRIDQYLTAGVGALDLVLLPTILPLGIADRALYVALIALSVSLVFTGWSLVISFIKRDAGIVGYGGMHSTLISISLVSGATALTATLWHLSAAIGVVFLFLTVMAFITCAGYSHLLRSVVGFSRQQQETMAPSQPAHQDQPAQPAQPKGESDSDGG